MAHDSDFFRRRAAEARTAAAQKDQDESVEVAGYLALAYAALARRKAATAHGGVDPVVASAAEDMPLMLRD